MEKIKDKDFISVAIVDDDANVRSSISWLLDTASDIRCLGAYASCDDAMIGMRIALPDVVLLDVSMPVISGIDFIPVLRAKQPSVKILMHSNFDDEDKIVRSRRAGAAGYVLKNGPAEFLYEAIRKIYAGGTIWPEEEPAATSGRRDSSEAFRLFHAIRKFFGK